MLVRFTNNVEQHKGMPIYINPDHIISVFENPTDNGSLVTCIYGSRGDTWQVEEGLFEVITLINGVKM